jgi:hypothetical protein
MIYFFISLLEFCIMFLSSALRRQTLKNLRCACKFSSSAAESPKITIAKNLLLLKNISEANDEESLQQVLSAPLPVIDINNLPAELKDLEEYLVLGASTTEKYIPDPTAWQNKNGFQVAADEAQREEVWPLIVGSL